MLFVRRANFACGTGTALLAKSIPLHSKLLVLKDLSEQLSFRKWLMVRNTQWFCLFVRGEDSKCFLHLFNLIILKHAV